MHKLVPALLVLAGACSTAPAEPPIHGVTPGHKCEAAGTDQFIGRVGDSTNGAAIMRTSHAAVLRWAPPGVMLTMDYREDRVTVHVGADGKITAIKCG